MFSALLRQLELEAKHAAGELECFGIPAVVKFLKHPTVVRSLLLDMISLLCFLPLNFFLFFQWDTNAIAQFEALVLKELAVCPSYIYPSSQWPVDIFPAFDLTCPMLVHSSTFLLWECKFLKLSIQTSHIVGAGCTFLPCLKLFFSVLLAILLTNANYTYVNKLNW
jgi:hypothetical protein